MIIGNINILSDIIILTFSTPSLIIMLLGESDDKWYSDYQQGSFLFIYFQKFWDYFVFIFFEVLFCYYFEFFIDIVQFYIFLKGSYYRICMRNSYNVIFCIFTLYHRKWFKTNLFQWYHRFNLFYGCKSPQ